MMTAKQIKELAALVGAIAGIVTGADKVKTTFQKWRLEYKERKDAIEPNTAVKTHTGKRHGDCESN